MLMARLTRRLGFSHSTVSVSAYKILTTKCDDSQLTYRHHQLLPSGCRAISSLWNSLCEISVPILGAWRIGKEESDKIVNACEAKSSLQHRLCVEFLNLARCCRERLN